MIAFLRTELLGITTLRLPQEILPEVIALLIDC